MILFLWMRARRYPPVIAGCYIRFSFWQSRIFVGLEYLESALSQYQDLAGRRKVSIEWAESTKKTCGFIRLRDPCATRTWASHFTAHMFYPHGQSNCTTFHLYWSSSTNPGISTNPSIFARFFSLPSWTDTKNPHIHLTALSQGSSKCIYMGPATWCNSRGDVTELRKKPETIAWMSRTS